jgi:hypothetical protein
MARSILLVLVLVAVAALAGGAGFFFGYRAASPEASADVKALEEEFARTMSGVSLQGAFTGEDAEREVLAEETYTIESVEKLAGDLWLFQAAMKFGDTDVTLPVPVRVLFAGDTPVVTLTDASLPGLGTYTARVVFYRERYAGLWWSSHASGHQFGRLVRP